MMTWLLVAVQIALLAYLLHLGMRYIQRRREWRVQYAEAARNFFSEAEKLVADDRTPAAVIASLERMNATINLPETASVMLLFLREEPSISSMKSTSDNGPADIVLSHMRAIQMWFMAVTALSPRDGTKIRKLLFADKLQPAIKAASERLAQASGKIAHA
jgi:hypothetical protein